MPPPITEKQLDTALQQLKTDSGGDDDLCWASLSELAASFKKMHKGKAFSILALESDPKKNEIWDQG